MGKRKDFSEDQGNPFLEQELQRLALQKSNTLRAVPPSNISNQTPVTASAREEDTVLNKVIELPVMPINTVRAAVAAEIATSERDRIYSTEALLAKAEGRNFSLESSAQDADMANLEAVLRQKFGNAVKFATLGRALFATLLRSQTQVIRVAEKARLPKKVPKGNPEKAAEYQEAWNKIIATAIAMTPAPTKDS